MKRLVLLCCLLCAPLLRGDQLVKTVNGLAIASVKSVNDLAVASVKSVSGLDNTVSSLFTDGFESNNYSAWTSENDSDNDMVTASDHAHSGTYSSKFTYNDTSSTYVQKDLASNQSGGAYCTMWIRFNDASAVAASNTEFRIMSMLDLSGNEQCRYSFYTQSGSPFDWARQNPFYFDDSTSAFAGYTTLTTTPAADTWYKVTLYWKPATGAGANNGILKTWFNGNLETNVTNLDTDTKAGCGRVRCGAVSPNWSTSNGTIFEFDDIEVGSGAPSNP